MNNAAEWYVSGLSGEYYPGYGPGGLVLPAAGAWTNLDYLEVNIDYPTIVNECCFFFGYTRGAAGGYPVFRFQYYAGNMNCDDIWIDKDSLVWSDPYARVRCGLLQIEGPHPADANQITFAIPYVLPRGATRFRFLAAELGVIANPGTLYARIGWGMR